MNRRQIFGALAGMALAPIPLAKAAEPTGRLVYHIEVGMLPKRKAEEYIAKVAAQHRRSFPGERAIFLSQRGGTGSRVERI